MIESQLFSDIQFPNDLFSACSISDTNFEFDLNSFSKNIAFIVN